MDVWITDSQDEQSIEELYRDAEQLHIPIFQREYVWGKREFEDLCRDIELIRDSIEKSQFMGAIVGYERPRIKTVVGRLRALDIVDGQQRLLTLYLFIMAVANKFSSYDVDESAEIIREFLLLRDRKGLSINTRVVPSYKDRSQFRIIWDKLVATKALKDILDQNPPNPPKASGSSSGKIIKQYSRINAYINKELPGSKDDAIDFLKQLLDTLTTKLTFVHLKLNDPSVATKIFQRLNFRGVKVGIVDLVRNDIFSRVDNDPEESIRIFDNVWRPFEDAFENKAEGFFFPFCLIHNSNIQKSELFSELRVLWHDKSPEEIVEQMKPYQRPYLALINGKSDYDDIEINQQITRFHEMRAPSAIFAFLLQVLERYQNDLIAAKIVIEVFAFVESFLVRRAIVGYEPTGLHAVFKSLWESVASNASVDTVKHYILSKPTIQYPDDESISKAINVRPLAKVKICSFLLKEYDRKLPGDTPSDDPTIEHILPQTYSKKGPWANHFDEEAHKKYVDTLANLIPLSQPLNSSVKTSEYSNKSSRYLSESMFTTPRYISQKWSEWNEQSINERNQELKEWVLNRWKY